ncbi:MAG: protein disulfide isomerase family protein [Bacteroidota bacterium]
MINKKMLNSKKIIGIITAVALLLVIAFSFYRFKTKKILSLLKVKKLKVPHLSINPEASNYLSKVVREKKGVSMVLFFRYGCHFSREFLPTFQQLSTQSADLNVFFGAVEVNNDVDIRTQEKKQIAQQMGLDIQTFPYIVIFNNGEVAKIMQGDEKEREEANIRQALKQAKDFYPNNY